MKGTIVLGILCITLVECIHVHIPQDYVEVQVSVMIISGLISILIIFEWIYFYVICVA